jgi:alpha-L-fucosidase
MKDDHRIRRRDWLMATCASLATAALPTSALPAVTFGTSTAPQTGDQSERVRRMQWWHQAKFGMFIHWGLYSVVGRHEWVMENEASNSSPIRFPRASGPS